MHVCYHWLHFAKRKQLLKNLCTVSKLVNWKDGIETWVYLTYCDPSNILISEGGVRMLETSFKLVDINYVTRDCTHQTGHRLLRVMNKDIDAAVMISITPQQHRNACILPWQLSSLQGPSFRDALLDYISQSPRVFRWGPITRFQQWNGSERNLAKSLKSRLSPLHQWVTFMKQITWK